jgi:hypothetical protein
MTGHLSQETLREMASRWLPSGDGLAHFRIHTDTTEFFGVEYGDIVVLDGVPFLIRHNAKEGRFGLDDEVKFWVKRAIDLRNGDRKFIKMVFHEKFMAHVGSLAFECFRSPAKEARILDLVATHKNFMHGYSVNDEKGNIIRIIDLISGIPLSRHVQQLEADHQDYYHRQFPAILDQFVACIEAIRFLHDHGEKHGDIRRDHIFIDRDTGDYRWIDFDFNYRHRENIYGYDLFGLGNVLIFLAGKGDILIQDLIEQKHPAVGTLGQDDVGIIFNNRIVNLQKIFPYISDSLNRILMHFSKGANWFYENTAQLLNDLGAFRQSLTIPS